MFDLVVRWCCKDVEVHPVARQDIVADDSRDHLLDATKLLSDTSITGIFQAVAPSVDSRRKLQLLLILYKLPHVIDEVPCLHLTAWRLLDAGEDNFLGEYNLASHCSFFSFQDAFALGVGIKSFIQNKLDVGVVFIPIHITPGVKIDGIRLFRVHDDEGDVLVTAQNSSKETIILKIAK